MNFTTILEKWYKENKRDLPWRKTSDPYRIWVSEVILQQTRIDQGRDYYLRFLEKFPTIRSLAEADEGEVLKIWQGLGYYSRARNMHAAAGQVMELYKGKFPVTCDGIRKLKGVGDYTAAAISSIAFGIPAPVVDGNVIRFFTRYFGILEPADTQRGKTAVLEKAKELIPAVHPGDFNQSVMEFGALQCKPVPDCGSCPVKKSCVAFRENIVAELPLKSKKPAPRTRYFHYLLLITGRGKQGSLFLKKRSGNDIWKNLFDFPLIETTKAVNTGSLMKSAEWRTLFTGRELVLQKVSAPYRHILSHQVIVAKFYHLEVSGKSEQGFTKVAFKDIAKYPVPRLIEKYLEEQLMILS